MTNPAPIFKETKAKKAALPKLSEDQLQANCFRWFRIQHPKLYFRMFAIPNAAKRSIKVAARMKRTGMLSGVFDIFLSVPMGSYHGLFIELKVGYNKLTDNQLEFMNANSCDYLFWICKTLEEFESVVKQYLSLKSKVA